MHIHVCVCVCATVCVFSSTHRTQTYHRLLQRGNLSGMLSLHTSFEIARLLRFIFQHSGTPLRHAHIPMCLEQQI